MSKTSKPLYLLKRARFIYDSQDRERAAGDVYGHPKFPDGFSVITSEIIGFDVPNNIVETINTRYEIESWQRRKGDGDKEFTEEEIEELFRDLQKSFRATDLR